LVGLLSALLLAESSCNALLAYQGEELEHYVK